MQLIIGSAQLGMKYGINQKKIPLSHLNKIYAKCKKNRINLIDTAQNYGESEKLIGKSKLNRLKIITKIKIPKKISNKKLTNFLENYFEKTKLKLNVKQIHAILIHDISVLNIKNKDQILEYFHELKKKKLIKYFGVSVYSPKDVLNLLKFFKPDIIQLPLNIIDHRFLDNDFLRKLKKKNILLASRSSFLQGFLIQEMNNAYNFKLKKFYPVVKKIEEWCIKKKISRLDACIHFIKKVKMIDYMIIGFDRVSHLNKIIKSFKKKQIKIPNRFRIDNNNLIDPRKWKL